MSLDKIPEDCDILISASNVKEWLEHEKKAINDYLNNGGAFFILLDAFSNPGMPEQPGASGSYC